MKFSAPSGQRQEDAVSSMMEIGDGDVGAGEGGDGGEDVGVDGGADGGCSIIIHTA